MTLNVRKRATVVAAAPPAIDAAKIEAFASGTGTASSKQVAITTEQKTVRDGFTMPSEDHQLFAEIQSKCLALGIIVNKSEIIRAGLRHLAATDNKTLEKIIKAVPKIKIGRPIIIKS